MARGRRPKPSALKLVRGARREDRVNDEEAIPPAGEIVRPGWLKKHAAAAWDEMSPAAIAMGVLTPADVQAFAAMCTAYGELQQLYAFLQRKGRSYKAVTEHGFIMRTRPEVAMLAEARKTFKSYAVEFGLTASSRARVKKPKETGRDDPLAKLLRRKVT